MKGQEKRRKARETFPSSPMYRAVGISICPPVSREATLPRCHMVALGSLEHSGVLLEAENYFNKSTRTNGVGIPSTVISAVHKYKPSLPGPRQALVSWGWCHSSSQQDAHHFGVSHWPWTSLVFRLVHWHPSWKLLLKFLARVPSAARSLFLPDLCSWHRAFLDDTEVGGQSTLDSAPAHRPFLG